MNKILSKAFLLAASAVVLLSCDEEDFLKEKPMSFLSPENAYVTKSDFEMATNGLYSMVRRNYYNQTDNNVYELFNATDVVKHARDKLEIMGDMATWCVPMQKHITNVWDREYSLIANANTALSRLDASSLSEDEKLGFEAQGRFFRAFGYRALVYLFGGVPLILEESASPRADYVRASKEEVLEAMREDFEFAAANLPEITKVAADGRLSSQVAKFYLAETLMSLGSASAAIPLLSEVISNPALGLMRNRFGTHKDDEGDVFHDLFLVRNQNRSSGNTEALWVVQLETDVPGGMSLSTGFRPFYLERFAGPVSYSLTDPEGKNAMLSPKNGRSDLNIGGRGVANMCNTDWWLNDLWKSDWDNDIRNSKHNIIRDCFYDDPKSKYYGKSAIFGETRSKKLATDWWRWFPWPSKITTPGDHPAGLYANASTGELKSVAGGTYLDQYMLRLPEVHLLRAEAYLATGDKAKAAEDINVVRSRAQAKPVAPADVTIDYILDERAREMVYEEMRRLTLGRLGKYVERVRKYNTHNGPQMKDYMELWPIPYSAIEANKDAVLEQNPGYTN